MQINRLIKEAQTLHQRGALSEAKKRYEQILKQEPTHGMARMFLAVVLQQMGQVLTAVDEARQAMTDTPNADAMMWSNYGVVLKNAGLLGEAEQAYEAALRKNPNLDSIKANLSTLYLLTGKLREAQTLCLELTEKLYEDPAPWLNLARIALLAGDTDRSAECLQQAEDIAPKQPDIQYLKARTYAMDKDDEGSFKAVIQALKLRPAHTEAWLLIKTLDVAALDLDALEHAAVQLTKCDVQQINVLADAVHLCRKHWLWEPLQTLEELLAKALENPINQAASISAGFTVLSAAIPQKGHLKIARVIWRQLTLGVTPKTPRELAPRTTDKKIKVAFLSSDLRNHAVAYNLVGFFEALPHEDIEWFAYSNSFGDDSTMRKRIRKSMDRFINIAQLKDAEVAERIESDAIDILIDLNNMTRDTRVSLMAHRPAPLQITMAGSPGSLGADGVVDYIFVSPSAVDSHNKDGFAESVVVSNAFAHDPVKPNFELAGLRRDHELPEAAVVLCSFNQHQKISPQTFKMWCEILKATENTVLWLVKPSDQTLDRMYQYFEKESISTDRLILAPLLTWEKHIARIQHADLILDSLPYGAHTTCADGLRAGVPVITLVGETWAGRVGKYYLDRCGLKEWITFSPDAYISKSIAYSNLPRIEMDAIKQEVYDAYWNGPLVNTTTAARLFAQLCLGIYDRKASGLPCINLEQNDSGELYATEFN